MDKPFTLKDFFSEEEIGRITSKSNEASQFIQKALSNEIKPIQNKPQVKILADSLSEDGIRLTTFECTYWRPMLAEVNTHRCFSRNSRSSRATPTDVLIAEIKKAPWGPCNWPINQSGMVAEKIFGEAKTKNLLNYIWNLYAATACQEAKTLADTGVHKEVTNRILEPFTAAHTIISSTDWNNFFALRLTKDAQPDMQLLAKTMREALDNSTPKTLHENEWHLPYITEEDKKKFKRADCCRISAARCARVSYKTFDGSIEPEKDLLLYKRLVENKHFSPLEHVATPALDTYIRSNFKGWNQLRKFEDFE